MTTHQIDLNNCPFHPDKHERQPKLVRAWKLSLSKHGNFENGYLLNVLSCIWCCTNTVENFVSFCNDCKRNTLLVPNSEICTEKKDIYCCSICLALGTKIHYIYSPNFEQN